MVPIKPISRWMRRKSMVNGIKKNINLQSSIHKDAAPHVPANENKKTIKKIHARSHSNTWRIRLAATPRSCVPSLKQLRGKTGCSYFKYFFFTQLCLFKESSTIAWFYLIHTIPSSSLSIQTHPRTPRRSRRLERRLGSLILRRGTVTGLVSLCFSSLLIL